MRNWISAHRRGFAVGTAALAVALTAAGCKGPEGSGGSSGGGGSSNYKNQLSIVMVTHGQASDPFWNVVKHGADQAAKDFNVKLDYEAPKQTNAVEQGRLIQAAVARKPDGLAVTITDANALAGPIKQALSAGIPVASLNTGAEESQKLGLLFHVGQSEELAGELAGKRIAQAGVHNALCVIHERGNIALEQRCDGFTKTMKQAGAKVTRLTVDGTDPSGSQRQIQGVLSKNSSIDGIFALGPLGFDPSLAAIKAANDAGKIKLATFDLSTSVLNAVKSGQALFAIDQQPYLQGYLAVEGLAQNARLGIHPVGQVLTGPNFVTKSDAGKVLSLTKKGLR